MQATIVAIAVFAQSMPYIRIPHTVNTPVTWFFQAMREFRVSSFATMTVAGFLTQLFSIAREMHSITASASIVEPRFSHCYQKHETFQIKGKFQYVGYFCIFCKNIAYIKKSQMFAPFTFSLCVCRT
jgi:hypothetical protein